MRFNSVAFAGKSLLASALLLPLAACGDAAAPVEEKTPAADSISATPAPVASEPVTELVAEPTDDTPVAASVPTRTPAPSARKAAPAPVATPTPTAAATPAADPHAGHDMSTMSDEDMKAMGHN
ncbi:hypothetical protein [Novosphingobium sp. MBES04]|uniref:hypothetical protein n=1 Tax=Novosphingobium sp. MBES04 TaxID=1206458 RepID=UPI000A4727CD|nr:hypothetical protein [Novosphingobium sp. MBES04]